MRQLIYTIAGKDFLLIEREVFTVKAGERLNAAIKKYGIIVQKEEAVIRTLNNSAKVSLLVPQDSPYLTEVEEVEEESYSDPIRSFINRAFRF